MQERKLEDIHPETTSDWLLYYIVKEVSLLRKDMASLSSLVKKDSRKKE